MVFKIFLLVLCVCIGLLFTMMHSLFRKHEVWTTTFRRVADLKRTNNIFTEQNQSVIDFSPEMEWGEISDIALLRSAYFDDRQQIPVIRIVALLFSMNSCSLEYTCFFVEHSTVVGNSSSRCVTLNLVYKMTPVFFECHPPRLLNHATFVTIRLRSDRTEVENILNATTMRKIERKIVSAESTQVFSCLCPLFDFQSPDKLFLFIEYYKQQGVSHFFVYHHSSSENTKSLLRKLANTGIITVVQSSERKGFDYFFHAQVLHMNDCILKSYIRNAKFVLTVDVDEFIWPKILNTTLKQLLDIKDTANSGSIDFKSAFYHLEKKNGALVFGDMSRIYPRNVRSKQALKPKAIYRQNVHSTLSYFPTYDENEQDPNDVIIYHLRSSNVTVIEKSNLFNAVIEMIVSKHNLTVDEFSSGSDKNGD